MVTDIKVGDTLVSHKDFLQSSPIMDGELLTVREIYNGTIYVIRNHVDHDIGWALDTKDYDKTYSLYKSNVENNTVVNNITIVQNTPEETPARIDAHYDFFYELSQFEADFLQVKVDPYFIAKQWRVGERDPSGILFHILKTIARFGDKNPKEREIKAIYLQIKRLAELEGVELE